MTDRPNRSAKLAQRREWWANEMQNATGGDAATSSSTSGVRPTPNALKEIVMTDSNPIRPWLDTQTAERLTDDDLATLDRTAATSTFDTRLDRDEYMRNQAHTAARVRRYVGADEIPMPDFVTRPNRQATWELTPQRNDAVRHLVAEYVDSGKLSACLEVEQHALSGRVETRVSISDCATNDPAELTRWALDLLALAGRWTEIREGQQ